MMITKLIKEKITVMIPILTNVMMVMRLITIIIMTLRFEAKVLR